MTQPTEGGSYLRDPETGALIRLTNTEALEADVMPPPEEGEDQGALSTDTSSDTNTAAPAAQTRKGR
ncbi:hypothetical protein RCWATERBOI_45 [Rhodobacter phage RcWaterboi]|nr:hypothetical protein RCWATERBOI_45 [Rhodobacter phage RcWaterboi]